MLQSPFSLKEFPPADYDQWRQTVEKDLKGAPFEKKLVTHTYEGIDLQPVYLKKDWPSEDDPTGFPGNAPFVRGSFPLGGALCGWDIRQEHRDPDLTASNAAILEDLRRGVTSLQLRFDAAGRFGVAPGSGDRQELIARDGLMLYTTQDLITLLNGVKPGAIGIALEAGASFMPAAAMLVDYWKQNGLDMAKARGAFNADPLAVLARDGELPTSSDAALKQLGDLAIWTDTNLPLSTSVRVGTGPYHHAGATATQDLAFSMATAVTYLRAMTNAGLDINAAAKQILFTYSIGCNQFLAIAKLRAARRLWQRVLEASDADTSPNANTQMRMHVRTSKRVITARDPWVNLLRNTVTTFAAATAGAQVITSEPFDAGLGLPDDFSRRIARNTQIILQEESNLARVVDPAGGSWFIEKLTDDIATKAWAIFQDIEKQGGMPDALAAGWIGKQIDSAFAPRLANIAKRKDAVTGVSEFPNLAEKPVEKREPDYEQLRKNITTAMADHNGAGPGELEKITGARGASRVDAAIEAAGKSATIAQLAEALHRDGQPAQMHAITPHPYARPFEEMRDASDAHLATTGQRPRVFLANMGPVAHFTARASFSRNFFEAGGFEVVSAPQGHKGADRDDYAGAAEDAAAAFDDSAANIAVICSSDKLYPDMVPAVAKKLKAHGAKFVILAGSPGDNKDAYDAAGVDRYIFIKCDVLGMLRELLQAEGVLA